ncbi:hypothetical protein BDV59DRAFT_197675 [Aspergillus ambiguus]|uniref:40S ribosomal protein eS30 n=1 Tax=Aspergillus ambiguus TaxID=176160 RepID=UPI003CCDAF3A
MGKYPGWLLFDGYKNADADEVLPPRQQVEKQEKPKQPKGRALKRVKYTRRFVNVTMTGGKRKMNPNPGN